MSTTFSDLVNGIINLGFLGFLALLVFTIFGAIYYKLRYKKPFLESLEDLIDKYTGIKKKERQEYVDTETGEKVPESGSIKKKHGINTISSDMLPTKDVNLLQHFLDLFETYGIPEVIKAYSAVEGTFSTFFGSPVKRLQCKGGETKFERTAPIGFTNITNIFKIMAYVGDKAEDFPNTLQMLEHLMTERFLIDYKKIRCNLEGDRMELSPGAIEYQAITDFIPMTDIANKDSKFYKENKRGYGPGLIDTSYRGPILLFGEMYYVKSITENTIYSAKGTLIEVSSEGYIGECMGYKFKIYHMLYSEKYSPVGAIIDVKKPDGTVVRVEVLGFVDGIVDDVEIAIIYAEEENQVVTGTILVYDVTTNVTLRDGGLVEQGGAVFAEWSVSFNKTFGKKLVDKKIKINEYQNIRDDDVLLENISIKFNRHIWLEKGESIRAPSLFEFVF
jgi:hypothetical protein